MYLYHIVVIIACLLSNCSEGQTPVRLVNGTTERSGALQVFYNGTWRAVCDDCFDVPEAWTICRMLNFTNGGEVISAMSPDSYFWIDDLQCQCDPYETIDTCTHKHWGQHNCQAHEAVGVSCYDVTPNPLPICAPSVTTFDSKCPRRSTPSYRTFSSGANVHGDVRVIGPHTYPGIGCVEIFYNGQWGSVCDDFWGTINARVICRQLGYDPILARAGVPAEYNHYRNGISPIIVLNDVQCHGNETRIDQCPGNQFGIHNCTANEKLCVSCQQAPEATPEIPAPLLQCNNGTISASFNRTLDSGLTDRHLSLASGFCPYYTTSTDVNFVTMNIPFDRCNTGITTNESHIVYYNTIRYNYTNTDEVIIRVRIIEVLVSCVFPRDLEASNGVRPLPQTVTKEATGRYNIRLQFFLNNQFQNPVPNTPLNFTLGEWLNAALTLEAVRSDLKLVVMHCEATPTTNQHNVINYPLFIDKCERDNTLTLVPLNSTSFGFRYQTFMFPYHEMVYIHCDALVCLQSEKTEQCDRSCNRPSTASTGRRRRDTEDESVMLHEIYHLTSPALRLRQIEGYNYIITDLNVTELGILRRGKQLNNTGDNEDIGTTIHTTLQGKTSNHHSTLSTTTTHQTSVQTSKSDVIDDEEGFNYDEPFVAGLGGFSRSSSQTLATSLIYIFSSFVVVVKTLFDI